MSHYLVVAQLIELAVFAYCKFFGGFRQRVTHRLVFFTGVCDMAAGDCLDVFGSDEYSAF